MTRCLVFVCLLAAAPVTAAAQPPPPPPPPPPMGGVTMTSGQTQDTAPPVFGSGAISGIVTDGVTGTPIAGALVTILGGGAPGSQPRPRQMTDSRGRYIFTHLPAAGFSLTVVRPGYLDGGYGRVPGVNLATRIDLAEGEWFTDGHVQLWTTASISGYISDEHNDPIVGIPVRILARTRVAGSERWVTGATATTDDRGHYRIPGLLAGEYIVHVPSVQVTLPSGEIALYTAAQRGTSTGAAAQSRTPPTPDIVRGPDGSGVVIGHYATPDAAAAGRAYPMMFHPASRTLDAAEVVVVTFGDERRNVDVQLRPVPTVSVSGRVIGPGESIANLPVRLVPQGSESMGTGAEAGITKTDAQGGFTFQLVPDGDYTILASRTVTEYSMGVALTMASTVVPAAVNSFNSRTSSMQVTGSNNVMITSRSGAGVEATGRASISVGNQPVAGVTIPLTPSVSVSGHFEWDGSPTPPEALRFPPSIRLEPADSDVAPGTYFSSPQAPGAPGEARTRMTFTIDNVLPGQYVLGRILAGQGWAVAAAEWNGRDVLTTPLTVDGDRHVTGLVIRMTTQRNSLTGTVRDDGSGIATGRIIVFPAAAAAWRQGGISGARFGNTTIQADGTYTMPMILPGEYYLAAIPLEDRQRANDPEYLAAIAPQATRITVTPNSALTQDLRVIHLRGGR